MEAECSKIKEEIYRISWSMRGGVSSHDLFYLYSIEDRLIMNKIISENIEITNKSRLPLI
jgi:hypothetical protein